MTKVFCGTCGAHKDFDPETAVLSDGRWTATCPDCGARIGIDPEDYTVPVGSAISVNGWPYVIRDVDVHVARFADILYDAGPEVRRLKRAEFDVPGDWRRLRHGKYGIERVCHWPRNQATSNTPCYNCVDRTKCNAAIFEALAEYEATGLEPGQVAEIARLMKRHDMSVAGLVQFISMNHMTKPY